MLWTAKLETGLPKIDEQHKELFRQADILLDKSQADRIPQTIKFLGNYVVKHFTDEQMIHIKAQYPKALPHRGLHDKFVARFKELEKKFNDSGDNLKFGVVLEINRAVVGWLKDHIMVHDMEFTAYCREWKRARAENRVVRQTSGGAEGERRGFFYRLFHWRSR